MKSISIILFLVFSLVYESMAQIGGDYVFNFIDLPATARITGMGGNLIAFKDDDPGQAADNSFFVKSGNGSHPCNVL